jgi:carbon-monoxide dehydrogenase small subunit
VQSIEGVVDDPVIVALRAAFTACHALQCGYCTPGMLLTARDIVLRLPQADDARLRLELSGNLCRCTGYDGIVRAIRRVLDDPPAVAEPARAAVPVAGAMALPEAAAAPRATLPAGDGSALHQTLRIALPVDVVWAAIQDPGLVAGCVPGARIARATADRVEGELVASLGPIRARFTGDAAVSYDAATRSGRIAGQGRDAASGTRLSVEAGFTAEPDGPDATLIRLDVSYALQGMLAQFGRGPVVRVFADTLAGAVAAALTARLTGGGVAAPRPLRIGGLLAAVIWRWLGRLRGSRSGG